MPLLIRKITPGFFFLLLVVFLALIPSVHADFSISGTLPRLTSGSRIQLLREDLDKRSKSFEGEFEVQGDRSFTKNFKGEAGLFSLVFPESRTLALAIDEGQQVSITADSSGSGGFSVKGSPDTKLLQAYESFRKESLSRLVYPPRARLNAATAAGASPEEMAPLAQAEVDSYATHKRELNDFTIEQVGNSIALYATSLRWDGDYRFEELQQQVDSFAKKYPNLAITRSMQERLRLFALTAIGRKAAPLSGQDLDGTIRSLDDFNGKFVLVDFWASWCSPCRVENRHYPSLLKVYAGKGFEVFGINLDSTRSSWGMASRQDKVTWPQISDLLGLKSPHAKAYNVSALPMNFLLDEEGRIIAKNLRGDRLAEKLEELLADANKE